MASKHRGIVKRRTAWLCLVFLMLYCGVAGRLFYVQVFRSHRFVKWAKQIRARDMTIEAARGCIYDRNGRLLAVNVETASVFANPKQVKDPFKTAVRVAALIGTESQTIEQKLNGDKGFVWLGRQLDPKIGDEVWKKRFELPGVARQRDTKRVYPAGPLAAQIIGLTNIDNKGIEGIESTQNDILKGKDGKFRAELDNMRRVIPETRHVEREPENGKNVYLTIDSTIQNIAEQALGKMGEKFKPQSACAIVIDPQTGEILALANYPTYDPNNARSVKPALWRNRAVADLYEPGSTLKVVTIAAGLNEGLSPKGIYGNCTGREACGNGRIRCSLHQPYLAGHGAVDMYQIIRNSCNIGAAHVAYKIGERKLYKYEKAFGLLDKPHAGFNGEAVGNLESPDEWAKIRLANIGFGQGINVTALQMAGAYAVIANDGNYLKPHIVKEIRNADGSLYKSFRVKSPRHVISKEAAEELVKMLMCCTEEGTGKTAQIDGRTVAGKTGSAQVARTDGRGYDPGAFIASFMGFAPASRPRLVIAVAVNRPKGSHWGATVAAPVFQEIGEKALWYLKIPSDAPSKKEQKKAKQQGDRKRLV